ncbi:DNA topoisomerase-3 [Sporobacter termitidis DSM 10068]|uniref:DNA topoisomerase 3 n=1 Tax=Sporobacter termitidis DSM 10068 TaxID=1123282 RepID=A0A1M5TZV8_9FIRM|nr:DNA topoisomerase III [Sporobacter termitidis]SHH56365.1 DNA topoisomerase-3 [Sporobacter termitidis DSM 10068]
MAKTLVLTEKPSVGRDIARVLGCNQKGDGCLLGDRYIVTWALGHLVTLADPEAYNEKYKSWNMDDLPMLPDKMKLVVMNETARQFKAVQALMKRGDIAELVIATDSGREGELVARWIMQKAGWNKPAKRLWISSQTDRAIKEGFSTLRPAAEYDNLYKSAQARAEADWLVGLNVTRALTCKFNASLSAGRVQTPTLALLVEREQEIKNFEPRDYWTVQLAAGGFTATWRDAKGQSMIFDRAKAEAIVAAVSGGEGVLSAVTREYKHQAPPAAYDLTELQRDANKKYAYTAKQTLSYMQSLYETHKALTYPRTDSRYITDDVAATLLERLKSVAIGDYKELAQELIRKRPLSTRYIVNNAKVTDHHAIIPTDEQIDLFRLSPEERNIFDLVVRRFIAVLSPAFEYEETKIKLTAGKQDFYAKGKIVKTAGWKAAYGNLLASDDEDGEEERDQSLPPVRQGDRVKITAAKLIAGKTKPPARYNEATLLTAMENPARHMENKELREVLETTSGLGTPATRAEIIEKLFSSFYAERRGKEIVPTSKGIQLVGIVPGELRSAELTAKWEQRLSLISKGKARDQDFIADMRGYAAKLVTTVKASDLKFVHDNVTREKCPDCGKFLLDVKGKKGKMLVCPDRECGYRKSVVIETNARCPNCHKKLEMRGEGENRMFTCICGHREKLSDFEKRKAAAGANKAEVRKFMNNQQDIEPANSALAEQLAKWKENQ